MASGRTQTFDLAGDATAIEFGEGDDAAVIAGGSLMIQRGADLDPVRQGVSRAVFGRFVFQRNGREQIAAAMTDGSFRILAGESWKEIENWPGVTSATAQVLRGRISGGAMDDVIVIDDRCRHGFGHHA